jgi:hypothetical protein
VRFSTYRRRVIVKQTEIIDFSTERSLAVNAGKVHSAFFDKIREFLDADDQKRAKMKADALEGLEQAGLISTSEKSDLASLTDTVIRQDKLVEESLSEIRSIARKLLDRDASPHASIVAAIAVDSLEKILSNPGPQPRGEVAHADVDGALVGGILGFELGGGPWGSAAGMLLGGAAASIAKAS